MVFFSFGDFAVYMEMSDSSDIQFISFTIIYCAVFLFLLNVHILI